MKIKLLTLVVFVFAFLTACSQGKKVSVKQNSLDNQLDSVSYLLGADFGSRLSATGLEELNYEAFIEGMETTLGGDTSRINLQTGVGKIRLFFQQLETKVAEKNKKEGEEFLAKNKTKEGVKVTKSGIQYIVLKEGKGKIPTDTSQVRVHYHGTLIDGKVFDSSVDRGEPVVFRVNGVIKGWQEILQMMPVGSKWKVFIPTDLAYGTNVRPGGVIKPNMALIFDIDLLEIVDPKANANKQK